MFSIWYWVVSRSTSFRCSGSLRLYAERSGNAGPRDGTDDATLAAPAISNWHTGTPVHTGQNLIGFAHANVTEFVDMKSELNRCGRETAALTIKTRLVGTTENKQSDHTDGTIAEQTRSVLQSESSEIMSPVRLLMRSCRLSRNKVTVK